MGSRNEKARIAGLVVCGGSRPALRIIGFYPPYGRNRPHVSRRYSTPFLQQNIDLINELRDLRRRRQERSASRSPR